jgi:dihydroorotase-like cyclic amidohydrolase
MYLIRNAHLINEESVRTVDVRVCAGRIAQIGPALQHEGETLIDARGLHLLPGIIVTTLAQIPPSGASASRAALAAGITCILPTCANGAMTALDGIPRELALPELMEQVHLGSMDLPTLVRRYAHAPADDAKLPDRGYVREGYIADLVLIDVYRPHQADGRSCLSTVMHTFVAGHLAYSAGRFDASVVDSPVEIVQ